MKVPKVGFDIDGVIANIYPVWLSMIAQKYNIISPGTEDIKSYKMWEYFSPQLTNSQINMLLPDVFKQINLIEPYYDSIEFIKWYHNRYLEEDECIQFITARREKEAKNSTEAWLKKWIPGINFKVLHCKRMEKYQFIKENLDAFVEDSHEIAKSISAHKPCFLVDRPWNRDYPFIGKNEHRISCLSSIKPWITYSIEEKRSKR
jgi:hypothetical protein